MKVLKNNNDFWSKEDFERLTPKEVHGGISEFLEQQWEEEQNPFPVEAFPIAIQKIIMATNESLNFPIDFIGTSILYAASVSIGNSRRVEIKPGQQQSAVLYLALVGKPGTNKSQPLSWAVNPIERIDNLSYEEFQRKKIEYDKFLAIPKKERDQLGGNEPAKPFWRQHLVNDITLEALVSVHSHNKRGLGVKVDELATWFKNFNRYNKGSEQEFWLSVWSGYAIKVNRKTSDPYNIPTPFISVAGTIQPGVLDGLAKDRTENGFLDRILFAYPNNLKKEYWNEKELDPKITESWQNIISKLLSLQMIQDETNMQQPKPVMFTEGAFQILKGFSNELTDQSNNSDEDTLRGILAKLELYAPRFALILQLLKYACNEGEAYAIDKEAVLGAITLVEYFKKNAVKVHSIISNDNPLENLPLIKQTVYAALPDIFKTGEGTQIAVDLGMNERTFRRFLRNANLFRKIKNGEYEKKY